MCQYLDRACLRCFLLLEQFDINIKPCSILFYLRDIFQNTILNLNRKSIALPATTHLAWDNDNELFVCRYGSQMSFDFSSATRDTKSIPRIQGENHKSLTALREMYTEGLKIHCGPKNCDPESILESYHSRWSRNQKEDGTHCGGLYLEDIVGAALHTFNSTRLEEKPERR